MKSCLVQCVMKMDAVADDLVEKMGSDEKGNMHYKVSGKMTLYDFERYFHTDIRPFDDSEMVTLTGYFLEEKPNPTVGEAIRVVDSDIKPLDFKDAYINEFEVSRRSNDVARMRKLNNNNKKSLSDNLSLRDYNF